MNHTAVEGILARDARWTLRQAIAAARLDEEFLRRDYLALGLDAPDLDAVTVDEEDLQSLRMLRVLLDAGIPEETVLDLARVVGRSAAQVAEAILDLLGREIADVSNASNAESQVVQTAERLLPTLAPLTATPVRLHLRAALRRERTLADAHEHEVAVAFADLVGFTALSDQADPRRLADVLDCLERLATEVAKPPVRLVKLVGDAAMLVSEDCEALLIAACDLVNAADDVLDMPRLRAGVNYGPALHRSGDWYGRTVNAAHRLAGAAAEGAVVATPPVAQRTCGRWLDLGPKRLKGLRQPVQMLLWQPST